MHARYIRVLFLVSTQRRSSVRVHRQLRALTQRRRRRTKLCARILRGTLRVTGFPLYLARYLFLFKYRPYPKGVRVGKVRRHEGRATEHDARYVYTRLAILFVY